VDAERTRVDLEEFRTEKTHEAVISLLTYYCKSRNVRYKQGLNELLAPMLLLHRFADPNEDGELVLPHTEAEIFATWTRFMDVYVPHLYDGLDGDMVALQTTFRLFDLLCKYHDPELWWLLDHNGLRPELYASPWIMTLFAQSIPIAQLFKLWEALVLGEGELGDRTVIIFAAVAFLCCNREVFLRADSSDLPVLLTSKLSYHHRNRDTPPPLAGNGATSNNHQLVLLSDVLDEVLIMAAELRRQTPESYSRTLLEYVYNASAPPTHDKLDRIEKCPCVVSSASWLVKQLEAGRVLVIDARSKVEFMRLHVLGGLRGVINMGVEMLDNPDELKRAIADLSRVCRPATAPPARPAAGLVPPKSLRAGEALHLCVIGERCEDAFAFDADQSTLVCVLHLLQHGFSCVSICQGGWSAVKQVVPPNFLGMGEAPPLNHPPVLFQPVSRVRSGGGGAPSLHNNAEDAFVVSRASVGARMKG
jgi:hypothetical protein